MPNQLKGRTVAFLATDGVEEVELTAPWNALSQAVADFGFCRQDGPDSGMNHDDKAILSAL